MKQKRVARSADEQIQEEDLERPEGPQPKSNLVDISDELLDEIDSLLEENAAEFVKNYVQRGGE